MTIDDDTQSYANDSATSSPARHVADTVGSGFDLEETRRQLIALRVKHGANTPIGHRCSNLVELLQNYQDAKGA